MQKLWNVVNSRFVLQEEYDEMMQTALDPVTDTITYEYYINQLMVRIIFFYRPVVVKQRPAGRVRPVDVVCAARDKVD